MSLYGAIDQLIAYAVKHLELSERDVIYARNRLLDVLGRYDYTVEPFDGDVPDLPDGILAEIYACLEAEGVEYDSVTLGEKLMDAVMLRPSEFEREVKERCNNVSSSAATDWAYSYAVHSNYVKQSAIDKNIKWHSDNGLEITINLSKPEKNNKDLAKQLTVASTSYPRCTICRENEGYEKAGFSRRNMRVIYLTLNGEPWFWQFSPYAYFNQHGIAIRFAHTPMILEPATVNRLFDFVDAFPHYFIGNNAPLPRVGGSILMHDHFQGGGTVLPMQKAGLRAELKSKRHPTVKVGVVDWHNTAFRLEGSSRSEIAALAMEIVDAWRGYENVAADIIPFTGNEPHNTASCIARKTANGYILDIILRNNRVNEVHPDGIFHAHREYHAIKSESIGLIEAMGLFILPARLYRQLGEVKTYLTGETDKLSGDTVIFEDIAKKLKRELGNSVSDKQAELALKREVENTCLAILDNTAVFKRNEVGAACFADLFKRAELELVNGKL